MRVQRHFTDVSNAHIHFCYARVCYEVEIISVYIDTPKGVELGINVELLVANDDDYTGYADHSVAITVNSQVASQEGEPANAEQSPIQRLKAGFVPR